jgi:hypothetical protein
VSGCVDFDLAASDVADRFDSAVFDPEISLKWLASSPIEDRAVTNDG